MGGGSEFDRYQNQSINASMKTNIDRIRRGKARKKTFTILGEWEGGREGGVIFVIRLNLTGRGVSPSAKKLEGYARARLVFGDPALCGGFALSYRYVALGVGFCRSALSGGFA